MAYIIIVVAIEIFKSEPSFWKPRGNQFLKISVTERTHWVFLWLWPMWLHHSARVGDQTTVGCSSWLTGHSTTSYGPGTVKMDFNEEEVIDGQTGMNKEDYQGWKPRINYQDFLNKFPFPPFVVVLSRTLRKTSFPCCAYRRAIFLLVVLVENQARKVFKIQIWLKG